MKQLLKNLSHMETRFDYAAERFMFQHHVLGFLMIFVGAPLLTLAAVGACTTIVALPVALFCGWL